MVDLLRTAVTGLNAFRTALATTGHNAANVNTPHYSRQRVNLATPTPERYGFGYMGRGVDVQGIGRSVDEFVLKQLRSHTSSTQQYEQLNTLTGQLGTLLGGADIGMTPDVEAFFGALQDMSNSPASITARQVFLDEARTLTTRTQDINHALNGLRDSTNTGIRNAVATINDLTSGIAKINADLSRSAGGGANAQPSDLLDTRDRMLSDLSKVVGVNVIQQSDGSLGVFMGGGQPLVIGANTFQLEAVRSGFDPQEITVALQGQAKGTDLEQHITSGELAGYFQFRKSMLNPAQDALGLLAMGIAETFNAQHEKGMDLDGELGSALFTAGSPKVWGHAKNDATSAAEFNGEVTDSTKLVRSNYEISYQVSTDSLNNPVYRYTAIRTLDNKTLLSKDDTGYTNHADALAALNTVLGNDGLKLNLTSVAAPSHDDRFLLEPTRYGAPTFATTITDPRKVAAAAPVITSANPSNLGRASISTATVTDPTNTALQNNVRIQFTSANTFDVLDLTAGAALATGLTYTSGSDIEYNGWSVSITGSPQASISGSPIAATPNPANTGGATITAPTVNSIYDPKLLNRVEIRFTSADKYDVFDTTDGKSLASGVSYISGDNVSYNGWTTQIADGAGTPKAGDVFRVRNDGDSFQVQSNQGGYGDNRNALALAKLETKPQLMGGNDYRGVYAQMIAEVGAQGRRVENTLQSQQALLDNSTLARESISGVNLDEEAADLLRFQQAYEASAQMIQTANSIFRTVLDAVRS